jgi:hypothetical protein
MKQKQFKQQNPSGGMTDTRGGISKPRDAASAVRSALSAIDNSFDIDYLLVTKVWDDVTELDNVADGIKVSDFGKVSGKLMITGDGKATTLVDALPLDKSNWELPQPLEVVPVIYYGGNLHYLNSSMKLTGNLSWPAVKNTPLSPDKEAAIRRKLLTYPSTWNRVKVPLTGRGSRQINSRFGSSILFDNNSTILKDETGKSKPTIRLSNNQNQTTPKFYTPGVPQEGSTILMTSGQSPEYFSELTPLTNIELDKNYDHSEKDTILLNSDRLILQSVDSSTYISSGEDVKISGKNVYVNNQPMVLSNKLISVIELIVKEINDALEKIQTVSGTPMVGSIKNLKTILKNELPDIVATEDRHNLKKKKISKLKTESLISKEPDEIKYKPKEIGEVVSFKNRKDITIDGKTPKMRQKIKEGSEIEVKDGAFLIYRQLVNGEKIKISGMSGELL